jgi:N-formylglutamate amidohydrolase
VFFSVHEPTRPETPLVVEVPHAGLFVDPPSLSSIVAPARSLGQDADLYVDELYADSPLAGATLLVARVSRYVCDLNRSETDYDGLAVRGGGTRAVPHGLIWRSTTEDVQALAAPLAPSELSRRLEQIYRPYHDTLATLLRDKHRRFGCAVLLCAHSMPSRGRAGHADPGQERADVVPGSRSRTSAGKAVIDGVDTILRSFGWSVAHDTPYRGGFSTGHYGRPAEGFHAIQIEIARRLYMDERTLQKKPTDFERTRQACRTLVERLGRIEVA